MILIVEGVFAVITLALICAALVASRRHDRGGDPD
jgi:hypothetical protein